MKPDNNSQIKIAIIASAISSVFISTIIYFNLESRVNLVVYILIFASVFLLIYCYYRGNNRLHINELKETSSTHKTLVGCMIVIIVGQALYFLAYYPGGFNLDASSQWMQAHGDLQLDNWHPVVTTLIYWILTRIIDELWFCILVQMLLFSLSIVLLFHKLIQTGCSYIYLIVYAFVIAINPAVGMNNVCLIKDVYFTIDILWNSIFLVDIYVSEGKWIESPRNFAKLTIALSLGLLIRHNGLLFVGPLLVCLVLMYRRFTKRFIAVCVSIAAVVTLVEVPVYRLYNVKPHSNTVGEVVGIPMSIMINAYLYDYDNTPKEVNDFLDGIADRRQWQELYVTGQWDSCRWGLGGAELLNEGSILEITGLAIKTMIACPEASYVSLRESTRMIWQIYGKVYWQPKIVLGFSEETGIKEYNRDIFSEIIRSIEQICNTGIVAPFVWSMGVLVSALLFFCVVVIKKSELSKLVFLIPCLSYVMFTALLLSGPNYRYFYFLPVLFPFCVYMVFDVEEKKQVYVQECG